MYRSTDYNAIIWALQQLFEGFNLHNNNNNNNKSKETITDDNNENKEESLEIIDYDALNNNKNIEIQIIEADEIFRPPLVGFLLL